MSSPPLISICLPLYNGAKHLAAALDSIINQDCPDFELLIADDGSEDESPEIAAAYARRDRRIVFWKNKERQGLFGKYNACLSRARARYIKPFAQDDLLYPQALGTLSTVLSGEAGVALVSSARDIIDENGTVTELKQPIARDLRAAGRDVASFHLINLNNWIGEPATVMFRAEYAGSGFDTSYYHYGDIEYWLRILRHGDFYYLQKPLACFRRHNESQTDRNHRELYSALDMLRLSYTHRELLADIEPDELLKRRLAEKIAAEHEHILETTKDRSLYNEYQQAFLSTHPLVGSELECLKSEASGFRLLASLSLSTVSALTKELDHEKRCRKDEHEHFVLEVNKMRQSIYWKLASPLRKMRQLIKKADRQPGN